MQKQKSNNTNTNKTIKRTSNISKTIFIKDKEWHTHKQTQHKHKRAQQPQWAHTHKPRNNDRTHIKQKKTITTQNKYKSNKQP